MSYAPKRIKSHITAKDLEDFQRKENTPIEINGQFYRMHPASIDEPDFDENDQLEDLDAQVQEASQAGSMINNKLVAFKEVRTRLPIVNKELVDVDLRFNRFMALQSIEPSSAERVMEVEAQYLETKGRLEEEKERIITFLDNTKAEIDSLRDRKNELDSTLPEAVARNNDRKVRNKAKLRAYEENLKTLNRNFNLVQEQGESDEAYVARIREQTQAIEDPNLVVDRFNLYEARRFKDNLKDIIRDTSVIETAYNTLFKEDDASIPEVNKLFALIKSRYEKMYGTFQLNDMELIRFLKQMIENPEETARRAEEEEAQLMGLAQGGAGQDYSEKYKALNKGRRFTIPKLVDAIITVFDLFLPDSFSIDVAGKPATLSKGERTGYNVDYNGTTKPLRSTPKPVLMVFYVGLLEKVKSVDQRSYDKINADINIKTEGEYGEGMGIPHEELPKSCKLGKIDVDLNKLFYKNVLSVSHNGFKINGVKNTPVGDEFVKIIMDLCKGKYPTTKDLKKLEPGETQTFDALLHLAGLHKRVEHTANKTVQNLKNRLTLIEGEMSAGNTNKDLYAEAKDIVYKLHHLGEITQNSANDYLKQMK